jgi:hypothetical protein
MLGRKLISLSIYCRLSNMLLTLESGAAMELQHRMSEQYWNFRGVSARCTLMMEAAGSNRNVGALDRR